MNFQNMGCQFNDCLHLNEKGCRIKEAIEKKEVSLLRLDSYHRLLKRNQSDQMKKVYITGIAGFIGFHLAKACIQKGYSVLGIDNFNDYYSVDLKKDRAKILKELGCTILPGDLADLAFLKKNNKRLQPLTLSSSSCSSWCPLLFSEPQCLCTKQSARLYKPSRSCKR